MGGFGHLATKARAYYNVLTRMLGWKVVRYIGVEDLIQRRPEGLVAVPYPPERVRSPRLIENR